MWKNFQREGTMVTRVTVCKDLKGCDRNLDEWPWGEGQGSSIEYVLHKQGIFKRTAIIGT